MNSSYSTNSFPARSCPSCMQKRDEDGADLASPTCLALSSANASSDIHWSGCLQDSAYVASPRLRHLHSLHNPSSDVLLSQSSGETAQTTTAPPEHFAASPWPTRPTAIRGGILFTADMGVVVRVPLDRPTLLLPRSLPGKVMGRQARRRSLPLSPLSFPSRLSGFHRLPSLVPLHSSSLPPPPPSPPPPPPPRLPSSPPPLPLRPSLLGRDMAGTASSLTRPIWPRQQAGLETGFSVAETPDRFPASPLAPSSLARLRVAVDPDVLDDPSPLVQTRQSALQGTAFVEVEPGCYAPPVSVHVRSSVWDPPAERLSMKQASPSPRPVLFPEAHTH